MVVMQGATTGGFHSTDLRPCATLHSRSQTTSKKTANLLKGKISVSSPTTCEIRTSGILLRLTLTLTAGATSIGTVIRGRAFTRARRSLPELLHHVSLRLLIESSNQSRPALAQLAQRAEGAVFDLTSRTAHGAMSSTKNRNDSGFISKGMK